MLAKDEIRNWVIYSITSPSGRVYIGKTSNFKQRVRQYKSNAKKQTVLNNSFKKYGINTHTFNIVEEFAGNLSMVNDKEMFWIRTYMSNINKYPEQNGMNLTDGGEGQIGMRHSQESKDKMRNISIKNGNTPPKIIWTDAMRKLASEQRKGKKKTGKLRGWTDEQRKEMSELKKGHKAWNKGLKYGGTKDERQIKFGVNKGKSINKGKKPSAKAIESSCLSRSIPILQYTLDGLFIKKYLSGAEASRCTGISQDTIRFIAIGKVKKPTKFVFKYSTGFKTFNFERRVFKQEDIKQKIA